VLNLIAGVVFISTPQLLDDPSRLKKHALFLLGRCAESSLSKHAVANIEGSIDKLQSINERFKKADFAFKLLSVYESEVCSQKKAFGFQKKLVVSIEVLSKAWFGFLVR
jgi:hypothetical protein